LTTALRTKQRTKNKERHNMRRIFFSTIFFVAISTSVFSQKYSNAFLDIGVSARSQAMGNTQVASANDVTASFWNPAGLVNIDPDVVEVGFTHSEWFAGISNYDYFGIASPLGTRSSDKSKAKRKYQDAVGFSFIRLGVDNIPNTLELYDDDGTLNYGNTTEFSAADYAMIFSYARKLPIARSKGLSAVNIGANAKIIHRRVGPFASAWGFGLDLGAQYSIKDVRIGLFAKDITSTFNAWTFDFTETEQETLQLTDNELPQSSVEITKPSVVIGVAYDKRFYFSTENSNRKSPKGPFVQLLAEANLITTFDGQRNVLISANPLSIDPRFGLELGYNDLIFLRGGVNNFQRATDFNDKKILAIQPNIGMGIKLFDALHIDYAFPMGKQALTENSHTISLILELNIPRLTETMRRAS